MIHLLTTVVAQYGLNVPRRWQQWRTAQRISARSNFSFNAETTGMRLFAGFLVSVPVFIQAPLVRQFPWLSLGFTLVWVALSLWLMGRPKQAIWGDLLLGFSWSW